MRIAVVTFVLVIVAIGTLRNSEVQASTSLMLSRSEIPNWQTGVDKSSPNGAPCLFDFERGEVPNCVLQNAAGGLFIAPQFLKDLDFDSGGLAALRSGAHGWIYVNRKGIVVIRGVPVMDNWADTFHDGLVRCIRNKKYGFANRSGQIVIPPIYDGAMNFEKGNAEVCNGCKSKCANPDCEYHVFSDGRWFLINTKGAILKQIHKDH